ncbi:MAG: alanine--tRNA ligase [Clostridia bacterium]|nr:alanine--tRNA ligase [Clostridia bacterium]
MITSKELKNKFLTFFAQHDHAIIKSASLIPENDASVLFTTAGMHPLIPYLMGAHHPSGTRLANVQKCVRTGDIEEVGDYCHLTFFEMLGNWSLGDYFKDQSIRYSYEFLTSKQWLGLDPDRLSVSVFAGDEDCPRDEISAKVWQECGIPVDRIFYLPKKNNWWIAGNSGPCGPDTEIFYDTGKPKCSDNCSPACDCGKYLEIWNNVFMQYNKSEDGTYSPLKQKNVDTGMGLERTVCVLNGYKSVYEIDTFSSAVALIEQLAHVNYNQDDKSTKAIRIIVDHIRTATFILGDQMGVTPSNLDKGYILRRVIRRAVRYANTLQMPKGSIAQLAKLYIEQYSEDYPELIQNQQRVIDELNKEEEKFSKTLEQGEKEFYRVIQYIKDGVIGGGIAFKLYDTFGFPLEMTIELANEKGMAVDVEGFKDKFSKHQQISNATAEQTFKGGLADASVATTNLHTATHLLLKSLRTVLNDNTIYQRGSNITPERLRFDFAFGRPLTAQEIEDVQKMVNDAIKRNLPISYQEMTVDQAKAKGAIGTFTDRYGERVKVYSMGDFSCEICGGPHAQNTGELGEFIITKEQSSSSGVRRIRGELRK